MNIKKIEAIIRPFKADAVLDMIGGMADGVTLTEVSGHARQTREIYRSVGYSRHNLLIKLGG